MKVHEMLQNAKMDIGQQSKQSSADLYTKIRSDEAQEKKDVHTLLDKTELRRKEEKKGGGKQSDHAQAEEWKKSGSS